MGKRCPTALAGHSATLTPQRATYATSALFLGIHREFIASCYLRFTGVGSFLYRCLVEKQASGPSLFRINPRSLGLGRWCRSPPPHGHPTPNGGLRALPAGTERLKRQSRLYSPTSTTNARTRRYILRREVKYV